VRPGAEEAVVEGLFAVGDGELVLRRVVPARGRSRSYVDGDLATAAMLAERAAPLLEIHGQHAQQALLQPRHQRDALDRFAGVDRSELRSARAEVRRLRARLEELGGDERARAREVDLLRYQLEEIDACAPEVGEEERLDAEESLLADAVAHRESGERAAATLLDDGGAADAVAAAVAALSGRSPYEELADRLASLAAELGDAAADLRQAAEAIEPDEERLDAVRRRRQRLVELRRKYGERLEDVLAYAAESRQRLEELTSLEGARAVAEAELAAAEARLADVAVRTGEVRRSAAPRLAAAVEELLAGLALAGSRVEVAVEDTEELPGAGEAVELRIAANPGSRPGSLARVASGGELSRVMLALRLVLTGGPPTMVFDEVDAGIGGEAALAVGASLARLAADRQVVVVTHLPQVAAHADHQLRVAKASSGSTTSTTVEQLDDAGRVVELSRMLSGSPGSGTARDHAQELLVAAGRARGR
jgi:DNA repair protein RecN (Recombination protein N)